VVYGAIIMIIARFLPAGLLGLLIRLFKKSAAPGDRDAA
jgi:hypothetical protein